jgi:hypothetical protein
MLEYQFVERGTLPAPTPQKRVVRLLCGAALLAYVIWQAPQYGLFTGTGLPLLPGSWIAIAILFYFFGDIFNIGLNRRWGRWPQGALLALLAGAVLMDLFLYGTFWGPPAGWLIHGFQLFSAFVLAVAFLVSAFTAAPG